MEEEEKQRRIQRLYEYYSGDVGLDELRTFTNKVVRKADYASSLKKVLPPQSHYLPYEEALSRSNLYLSQNRSKRVTPNLKGLDPREKLFLTSVDGRNIVVENLRSLGSPEYDMINSNIFQKSMLDSRIGQKKIAKTQLDKLLSPVSRSIPQERVVDRLEDLLAGETNTDVTTLKRENEDLTEELDALLNEK